MRLSAAAIDSLNEAIDFAEERKTTFDQIVSILKKYIEDRLLTDLRSRDQITESEADKFRLTLGCAADYWYGHAPYTDVVAARVAAWDLYDRAFGALKHLTRLVIVCLFNEEEAQFGDYGVGPILEVIVSELFELDESYCSNFSIFFQREVLRTGRAE